MVVFHYYAVAVVVLRCKVNNFRSEFKIQGLSLAFLCQLSSEWFLFEEKSGNFAASFSMAPRRITKSRLERKNYVDKHN